MELLKPPRLCIDPNSPLAGKEWKHWVCRFEGYVSHFEKSMSTEEANAYKLRALVNYADTEVYGYFDHCQTYEEAALERSYRSCMSRNRQIFTRGIICAWLSRSLLKRWPILGVC